MATQATQKNETQAKAKEKTRIEQFMELEGSNLVIPPSALSKPNRNRAMAILAEVLEGADRDKTYSALLNATADCIEFLERRAVKDRQAFVDFVEKTDDEVLFDYCMKYLYAAGE